MTSPWSVRAGKFDLFFPHPVNALQNGLFFGSITLSLAPIFLVILFGRNSASLWMTNTAAAIEIMKNVVEVMFSTKKRIISGVINGSALLKPPR